MGRVARLEGMAGIGVDRMGAAADAAGDPSILRLENLDTDMRPLPAALEATRRAIDDDAANSYLPSPATPGCGAPPPSTCPGSPASPTTGSGSA